MQYSNLLAYFNREAKRGGCWDETMHNANPKIIVRQIGSIPICAIDEEGFCCLNTVFMIVPKTKTDTSLKFILGILNSNFMGNYWSKNFSDLRQTFPKIKGSYLEKLPIPIINFKNKKERTLHVAIVQLVATMLQLQKEKQQTNTPDKLNQLNTRIQYTDEKINKLVYELYGLSEEEIAIIV